MDIDANCFFILGGFYDHFSIVFGKEVMLSPDSTLDFYNAKVVVFNATGEVETAVGNVYMKHVMLMRAQRLVFGGKISMMSDTPHHYTKNTTVKIVASDNIYFRGTASIEAGNIMVYANGTVASGDGFNITSTMPNTCNQVDGTYRGDDIFTCMPYKSLDLTLDPKSFLAAYNNQFNHTMRIVDHIVSVAANNYTVYVVGFKSIDLSGSTITGSRIGMCSPDVDLYMTNLDSAGMGCRSDHGIGRGRIGSDCSGNGGAHGGLGGYGGVISKSKSTREGCQMN